MSGAGTILVSAGEFSGDLLAAELVTALRPRFPDARFVGVCGPAMRAAGVCEIADQKILSVMGIVEVLPKISELKFFEAELLETIDREAPSMAILVDSPGFHFRLAEQLKMRGIPVVQYVAPKVWAWGQKRVAKLRRDFDLVVGVLPFEKEFFCQHGVNYQLAGSPHVDRINKVHIERSSFGFGADAKILGLLPGSRDSELQSNLPDIVAIFQQLLQQHQGLKGVLPLAPSLSLEALTSLCEDQQIKVEVSEAAAAGPIATIEGHIAVYRGMSLELMAIADAALVASGTATFECGLLEIPMVVMYKMNRLTYQYAKKVVDLPYVSLINLVAAKAIAPEFIQEYERAEVAAALNLLLDKTSEAFLSQKRELAKLKAGLAGGAAASGAAAIEKWWETQASTPQAQGN